MTESQCGTVTKTRRDRTGRERRVMVGIGEVEKIGNVRIGQGKIERKFSWVMMK